MLNAPQLSAKHFLVYGLARSGLAAVGFLLRSGARVTAWDDNAAQRTRVAQDYPAANLADWPDAPLGGLAGIVLSPGVPLNTHPLAAAARAAGVPLLGNMELFQWARPLLPPHKVVAITGTNGKSTTTALIHHVLADAGIPAALGGNIGAPVLAEAPLPAGGVYVLELSSFQIDLATTFAADVAIYTNLTPDHLDRYDGMAGYAAAKARLFAMQRPGAVAVIATDDDWTRAAADALPAGQKLVRVSRADVAPADQARWPALRGPHNAQNVACARAALHALGVAPEAIEAGFASFGGLAHRMQIIGTKNGVTYVNDSKATNPTSVAPALQAFEHIHWILGGHPKTDELDACLPHLAHVRAAYVIGEAAPMFHRILGSHVPVEDCGTIDAAVRRAAAAAQKGDTVLLSPACSSYDQFRNFEERGHAFEAAFRALATEGNA